LKNSFILTESAAIPPIEQLIIDKLTNQISEEDNRRLDELLASDNQAQELWQQMSQVQNVRKLVSFNKSYNPENSWQTLQDKLAASAAPNAIPPATDQAPVVKIGGRRWLRYSAAAIVAGVVVTAGVLFFQNRYNTRDDLKLQLANGRSISLEQDENLKDVFANAGKIDANGINTLSVPNTASYKLQLADGTQVWMNAATDLNFPYQFNSSSREVTLKGEAYFKVAQNAGAPFVVKVNGVKINVLGTEFNVKAYPGEPMQISLVNGKVSVERDDDKQILQPGEAVDVQSGKKLAKISFDETMVLGWMHGIYYFKNEELGNIIPAIERWFDVQVKLDNPSLAKTHITGALEKQKYITDFLEMLSKTTGINYETNGGEIILRK
jgi:ferric-dicitrate binding protein FerR (iron transport regulator)